MRSTQRPRLAVSLAFALLASSLAQANSIQLKFEGGSPPITGYSTLQGYERRINVDSFQWGAGVTIERDGRGAMVSAPVFSEIYWSQAYDPSYNALSQALWRGVDDYKSTFSFLRAGADPFEYLTIATERSAISSLSVSSGGGAPNVSASLAFRKIDLETFSVGAREARVTQGRFTYDSGDFTPKGSVASGRGLTGAGSLTGGSRSASGLYLSLGADFKSESTVRGYEEWIQLDSMQMGMGIVLSQEPGKTGGFIASRPSFSELSVTRSFDRTVDDMLGALFNGVMIPEAKLELVQDGRDGAVTTMQLKLKDVYLSGLSLSSGGDLPQVSQSLNFSGYTQTIWEIGSDGHRGGGSVFEIDSIKRTSSYSTFSAPSAGGLGDTGASMGELPGGGMAAPIPEPEAWALMSGGLVLVGWLARRRRKAGQS